MAIKELENHNCDHAKYSFEDYFRSLLEASSEKVTSLNSKDIALLWDFYVHHAPTKKNIDQKTPSIRHLSEYGWGGTAGEYSILKLESSLCRIAGLQKIIMLKSSTIKETLASMGLNETGCITCSRAVLKHSIKIAIDEYGDTKISDNDGNRMICLFRHIRNSFSHGNTYFFENGNMMLEDFDENQKCSAKIILSANSLIEWIWAIDRQGRYYKRTDY